jgi:hypothetical protein
MDELDLEKHVDYVFKTPSGANLRMKNGAAIIIRGHHAEILSSLEDYYVKYKDNSRSWNELTDDKDKRILYAANADALKKIKWIEVEAVVEAARKLETADRRKSLTVSFVGLRNDLLNGIVSFPLVIFILWGPSFGLQRYFDVKLSHFMNIAIAAFAAANMTRFVPQNPGRVAFILSAIGYLLIGLVLWKFD